MYPLVSKLDGREEHLERIRDPLEAIHFTLGGNWDYEHGCFDCSLDEAKKVWLRLPFEVIRGNLDAEQDGQDAVIRMGTPYVLKHIYNEGLDAEAVPRIYTSFFDQFQDPLDRDANIEESWINQAKQLLNEAESILQ